MILGIDASNIRSGGGLTHLKEILNNCEESTNKFGKVIVWSSIKVLNELPSPNWLDKRTHRLLNKSFLWTFFYQFFYLSYFSSNTSGVNLMFVPGGTFLGVFPNVVTMSQNMLPFERKELRRYRSHLQRLKFTVLRKTQSHTFKKSKGVIFLTKYAQKVVTSQIKLINEHQTIIPHGISLRFSSEPKTQKSLIEYDDVNPFRLLYVSNVAPYKHQWNVASAVIQLRSEGLPITLDLIGSSNKESIALLENVLGDGFDDSSIGVNYLGEVQYCNLPPLYRNADGFIFASTCENLPIILLEAMTSGLPIISSNYGPMPEVLGTAGFYFDPCNVEDIRSSLKKFLESPKERSEKSNISYNSAINYHWKDCANKTFKFLLKIGEDEK